MLFSLLFLKKNKKIMELKTVSTCINCENLVKNFICSKHEIKIGLYNVCDSHIQTDSLTKQSNCLNCSFYGGSSCANPEDAAEGMLCFDWEPSKS